MATSRTSDRFSNPSVILFSSTEMAASMVLVFDAIGKYTHPTCYRQIVETQSLNQLTSEE